MRFRRNVILQYTAATSAIVLAVTVTIALVLTARITDYQIRSHIRLYQEVVNLTVRGDPDVYALFDADAPNAVTPKLASLFREFLSLGNIFRVKVWGRDATILWSDQQELIGQRFPDNDGFVESMKGTVAFENARLEKAENIDEKSRGITLEIYTPVRKESGGSVAGVVELYEADRDLFDQIARNTAYTWALVVLAGVVLWLALFFIFLRSYRTQRRTSAELIETQDVTIFALAYQAELRDRQTGQHLERTARYVRLLAEALARLPRYRAYLTTAYIGDLVKSAPLHDIGKVGIPDAILLKPGRLTGEEMAHMRRHCEMGSRVLLMAQEKLQFQSYLSIAIQLVLYHHEKWDGSGYPQGLAGEDIPLSGRIMALADNYDAMRTERPYKTPFPHGECLSLIEAQSGGAFDPELVAAFRQRAEDFRRVSEDLAD